MGKQAGRTILCGVLSAILLVSGRAQAAAFDEVDFATSSSSREANAHFLRGLIALHSFWYEVASSEFRASTKIDPNFMMGYWGEAMSLNYPLWDDRQDTVGGRQIVAKIHETKNLTPKERLFLDAIKILYGKGSKAARDDAYAEAMKGVSEALPDDIEASSLYALALLGAARPVEKSAIRLRMQAGAIAQKVLNVSPNHPGGLHYIIHAFDDPDHAILALDAARRYAKIAPEAPHALHMPSHIFLQLGLWPEAAASNEAAWQASVKWDAENHSSEFTKDFHDLEWLNYSYLQQGRFDKAQDLLKMADRDAYLNVAATLIVESKRWDLVKLLPPITSAEAASNEAVLFARGLAAAALGQPEVRTVIKALRNLQKDMGESPASISARIWEIQATELTAADLATKHRFSEAIALMKKATSLEEGLPSPSGPPETIMPAHELFGEILLAAKRPSEAADQFEVALYREPNRARSLLGAARAAAQQRGQAERAAKLYASFARQWQLADPASAELREANAYLSRADRS